jgi:hypothetical protein
MAAQKRTDEDIRFLRILSTDFVPPRTAGTTSDRMRMNNLFHEEINPNLRT